MFKLAYLICLVILVVYIAIGIGSFFYFRFRFDKSKTGWGGLKESLLASIFWPLAWALFLWFSDGRNESKVSAKED